jgi:DNA-binding MarR family transcriptional regulator
MYNPHMDNTATKEYDQRRSDSCYGFTNAIMCGQALQATDEVVVRQLSAKLSQWGLSLAKYGVLLRLYDHDSLPLSKIGSLIFRGNSNLTTLIDRMERDGFVEEVKNSTDRRIREVGLTRKGREMAPKIIYEVRNLLDKLFSQALSEEEQKTFIAMLRRIRRQSKQMGQSNDSL